jgi:hypothetical protein
MADQRDLTQEVVETDVNQTDRQRRLSQIVIEADHDPLLQRSLFQEVVETEVDQGPKWWRMSQFVIEVDGDNWGFATGRILSAQFV